MEAPDLDAALAVMRAVRSRAHTASDEELLTDGAKVEELGRLVDAHRLAFAAEAERRTMRPAGGLPLAFREGTRDAVDLVAQVARVDRPTAKRRIGLGAALAPVVSVFGEALPGRFGTLADAVAAGEVGVDSARVIVETVLHLQRRITAEQFTDAVEFLTGKARVQQTELVRDAAVQLAEYLDPDGAEPNERAQRLQRTFTLGRERADGMTSGRLLLLTPEHAAVVKELLEAQRRTGTLVRTTAGGDETTEQPDPEWREGLPVEGDEPRSRAQQDYDTLLAALEAGTRAEQSAATTHEVVIHVTASDLEARRGRGWTSGVLAGLPIPVIERKACTGGMRLLVTGDAGEALYLGRSRRLFSPAQKKALIARAGGRCEVPGCTTPAPFLEAHHVAWFDRDQGRTDISNGVMLCSHHHLIHSPIGRLQIRKWAGELWFVPIRWRGDPREEHRRQPGPHTNPNLTKREPDPPPDTRAA